MRLIKCIKYIIAKIVVMVLLFPIVSYAQIDFRDGYIVKLNGDTLKGLIAYGSKVKRSTYCVYKDCKEGSPVKYSAKDLIGYGYKSGDQYNQELVANKFKQYSESPNTSEKTQFDFYLMLGISNMKLEMQGNTGKKYRMDQYLFSPSVTAGFKFYSIYDKLEIVTEVKYSMVEFSNEDNYTLFKGGFDPEYVSRENFISLSSISFPIGVKYNFRNPCSTPTIGGGFLLTKFINPEVYFNGSYEWPSNQSSYYMSYEFDTKQLPNSGMWLSLGYLTSLKSGNKISFDFKFEKCFPRGEVEKLNSYGLFLGWYF